MGPGSDLADGDLRTDLAFTQFEYEAEKSPAARESPMITDDDRRRMKKFCEENGIEYHGGSTDHPMLDKGFRIVSMRHEQKNTASPPSAKAGPPPTTPPSPASSVE